tara:strand:- start:122 stop:1153 length:1032 start_codon:yes stop_codon:yes gene_type:complete
MNDEIVNKIIDNKINIEDIDNIIKNYKQYDNGIIKFFLLRFPKEVCKVIIKYFGIIDNLIFYIFNFHSLRICENKNLVNVCEKYDICVSKCKCYSTIYWYELYKLSVSKIKINTFLIDNDYFMNNFSDLIKYTKIYDYTLDTTILRLFKKDEYLNILIDFIRRTKLYSKFYLKILDNIECHYFEKKVNINYDILKKTMEDIINNISNFTKITNNIYITNLKGVNNICNIRYLKVKHIVSLTKKDTPKYENINHYKIMIEDNDKEEFIKNTITIAKNIIRKINNDECVLVHCVKGLSRSPAFVILLLLLLGNKYNDIYKFIQEKKYFNINPKFINELKLFDTNL